MREKFKLKITDWDNKPIIKAQAEKIEDFEPVFEQIKKKFKGDK